MRFYLWPVFHAHNYDLKERLDVFNRLSVSYHIRGSAFHPQTGEATIYVSHTHTHTHTHTRNLLIKNFRYVYSKYSETRRKIK